MESSLILLTGVVYQLVNYLMPSADPALLTMINTSLVVLLPMLFQKLKDGTEWFYRAREDGSKVSVRETNADSDYCDYFKAMSWFIDDKLTSAVRITVEKTDYNGIIVWPEEGCVVEFEYEEQRIKAHFCFCEDHNGKDNAKVRSIELSSESMTAFELKRIVQDIQRLHEVEKEIESNSPNYKPRVFQQDDRYWDGGCELIHNKRWSNVVLEEHIIQDLKIRLDDFIASKEWYFKMGLSWTLGLLFSGPPGCGKTSCIKLISHEYRLPVYILNLSRVTDDQTLSHLFRSLPSRCILVLEDVDCACTAVLGRNIEIDAKDDDDEKTPLFQKISLSQLLQTMDGVIEACGRIVIMTTNYPERLDPALIRSRRIDAHYKLGPCSHHMLNRLFEQYAGRELTRNEMELMPDNKIAPVDAVEILISTRKDPEKAVKLLQDYSV
jgi:hypothetical protein